mmetsp:Transcript_78846/g.124493  ORF Transcript_78846/g.124493 Transcript_78846/m.124493 type:complete len:88 (+) Transcript_78846:492-755(+)
MRCSAAKALRIYPRDTGQGRGRSHQATRASGWRHGPRQPKQEPEEGAKPNHNDRNLQEIVAAAEQHGSNPVTFWLSCMYSQSQSYLI